MHGTSAILNCNTYLHQKDGYGSITHILFTLKGQQHVGGGIYWIFTETLSENNWQSISMIFVF